MKDFYTNIHNFMFMNYFIILYCLFFQSKYQENNTGNRFSLVQFIMFHLKSTSHNGKYKI